MSDRVQLWSCGMGRQSALVLGLICRGDLPRPDHVVTVDTGRERASSWDYVERVFRPELAAMGVPFTVIDKAKYATVDLWGGEDGRSFLPPAFSTQGAGGDGKLPEFCSVEWKQRSVMRWAAEQAGWKDRGVDCWLGITTEERHRRRGPKMLWWHPTYPLLDACPSHVSKVYDVCAEFGWPDPPRSCCWLCPNMGNAEWRDVRDHWPDDFAKAVALDDEIRARDPHLFLHRSRVPLKMADLGEPEPAGLFSGGCTSGFCS